MTRFFEIHANPSNDGNLLVANARFPRYSASDFSSRFIGQIAEVAAMLLPPFDRAQIQNGLQLLHKAASFAEDAGCCRWQFAVELGRLYERGLSQCDLRWMLRKGLIDHGRETTRNGDIERVFDFPGGSIFDCASCFILSNASESLTEQPTALVTLRNKDNGDSKSSSPERSKPSWNPEWRALTVAGVIVKQFKTPAPNQQMVLTCFQEEGWPPRIDDPLSPDQEIESKRRLHDTVNSLNRCQKHPLIRFEMDGTGEGVLWRLLPQHNAGVGASEQRGRA